MKVVKDISSIYSCFSFPVVTLGNFDGVHLGHQYVIKETVARAKKEGGTSIVITFTPHTKKVLVDDPPLLMTTDEQKKELIGKLGADILVFLPFDGRVAATPARDFVLTHLVYGIGMKAIYLSRYFGLGKGRGGDSSLLRELSAEHCFEVVVVDEVIVEGEIVSSSSIRERIVAGKVDEAACFLGRNYFIDGKVIPGERRGARLSFPTANLKPENELIPGDGVYITLVSYKGEKLYSLTNIGPPATFGVKERRVEVHLLDFNGELYGERIRVHFLKRLRPVRRFDDEEQLKRQIKDDVSRARDYFSSHSFISKSENC